MSEQSAVTEFRRSFKVGKFTITLRVPLVAGKPAGIQTEWEPYYPGGLSGQLFRKYRHQRMPAWQHWPSSLVELFCPSMKLECPPCTLTAGLRRFAGKGLNERHYRAKSAYPTTYRHHSRRACSALLCGHSGIHSQ